MLFGYIAFFSVGLMLIIFGILIAFFKKINLIHDYHVQNVKEEDKNNYLSLIGISLIIIGISIICMGILLIILTNKKLAFIPLVGGLLIGIIIIIIAQKKYNGGIFSWLCVLFFPN